VRWADARNLKDEQRRLKELAEYEARLRILQALQ
jgi:hypothetical protein